MQELVCYNCGGSLAQVSMPLRRLELCPHCDKELHVCRMCEFYDTGVARSCREPVAAEVRDKERANFCDYLQLTANAWTPPDPDQADAEARLRSMFGDSEEQQGKSQLDQLNELFGQDSEDD